MKAPTTCKKTPKPGDHKTPLFPPLPTHKGTITVLVDSREQRPLNFPPILRVWFPETSTPSILSVCTKTARLDYGDYAIEGYQPISCVERKAGISELHGNLHTKDRVRFLRAFHRLVTTCASPILLIESMRDVWWTAEFISERTKTMDEILQLAAVNNVQVVWGWSNLSASSTRMHVGELMLRMMLSHVWNYLAQCKTQNGATS